MSLNEDYLDDLLKAVTVEEENSSETPENKEKAIDKSSSMMSQVDDMASLDESIVPDQDVILDAINAEEESEDATIDELQKNDSVKDELTTDVSDIEELLKSVEEENDTEEKNHVENQDQDLLSMLESMGEDSDLAEIGELLNKDENHEVIETEKTDAEESSDISDILSAIGDEDADAIETDGAAVNVAESGPEQPTKEKKKLFGKKKKKVETEAEAEKSETKKKGFFAKLLDIFFEEDDLDTEEPGVGEEGASEENQAIMAELDGRKKPKAKKEKKEKEKKPKKQKAPKEKKAPKPKKEKKPKEVKEPDPNKKPEKKIPRKKIILVAIFAMSVFSGIYVLTSMVPETMAVQTAKEAYSQGDYRTVYTTLAGMDLNEEETALFRRTTVILEIQGKFESYLNYQKMGMGMEALNALLKGIEKYDKLYSYGEEYGVTVELDKNYQEIITALNDNYGLSEEEARQILDYDRVTYTKKLDSLVNGTEFIDPNTPVAEEETLPDMLPEEEALLNMTVIDGEQADQQEAMEESTEDMLPEELEESKELYRGSIQGDHPSVDFSQE